MYSGMRRSCPRKVKPPIQDGVCTRRGGSAGSLRFSARPTPKRWITISRLEQVELGIPSRSVKATALDPCLDYILIDRRCLARYHRRWRELPTLYGFREPFTLETPMTATNITADNLEEKYGPILDSILDQILTVRKKFST